jgi:hypothetical protein
MHAATGMSTKLSVRKIVDAEDFREGDAQDRRALPPLGRLSKRPRAAFAGGVKTRGVGEPGDLRIFEIRDAILLQVTGHFAEGGAEAGA